MAKVLKILFVVAAIPLLLVSCKSEQSPTSGRFKRAKISKPAPVEAVAPDDAALKKRVASKASRRNPFLSYIAISTGAEKAVKVKGPLECCELNLFRLVAVVVSPDSSFALVESPDKKRYIVRRGDLIGRMDGKITRINTRSITVREYEKDVSGKVISTSDEELRLPTDKGSGR
jgi:Tfp pilus assembly protein PilP